MSLHKDYDENQSYTDFKYEEEANELKHKKHVRLMIEERLERKRLKAELEDELDEEFDWGKLDR